MPVYSFLKVRLPAFFALTRGKKLLRLALQSQHDEKKKQKGGDKYKHMSKAAASANQGGAPKQSMPDLTAYENKQVTVRMDGGRSVSGTLGGYDQYMNVTLKNAFEVSSKGSAPVQLNTCVIRGSSIANIEAVA